MLAQTNLQLYRVMIEKELSEDSLVRVQNAYEIARSLFGNYSRPSHKPFVCHLVGTCSALLEWNQSIEVAIAGLLHSSYLYGDFQDGDRGITTRRRNWLQSMLGHQAESYIFDYTKFRKIPLKITSTHDDGSIDPVMNIVEIMKLADLLDELSDCGAMYAPKKKLDGIEFGNPVCQEQLIALAQSRLGYEAANHFRRSFEEMAVFPPYPSMISSELTFARNDRPIVAVSRSKVGRAVRRVSRKLFRNRAA